MTKPRAQTLQQRFGFQDKDLLTPTHDAIMIDLDAEIEQIIASRFYKAQWPPQTISTRVSDIAKARFRWIAHQEDTHKNRRDAALEYHIEVKSGGPSYVKEYAKNAEKAAQAALDEVVFWQAWGGLGDPPPKPPLELSQVVWESPVMSGKFIVGFIDLRVTWSDWRLHTTLGNSHTSTDGHKLWSLDESRPPCWDSYSLPRALNIEVKTTIRSVGELLRQIRMYKEYQPGSYLIVSPDDRFQKQIEGQGLHFLKYLGPNHQFELPID